MARRPRTQQQQRGSALLLLSLVLLVAALATPGATARRAGGGGGFGRSSFSSRSAPVSSGYSYKPTFTPAGAPAKPAAASAAKPASGGGFGSTAGLAGAASSGALLGRRRSSTPLIVPFALGAGGGLLVSSALRSGQRCGDGRLECYREACAQAQGQCGPAAGRPLARAPCPPANRGSFAECWAAGGGSSEPDFVCNGKANPSGPSDVEAFCLTPDVEGEGGGNGGRNGALRALAGGGGGVAMALSAVMAAMVLV
jgi:hypothetical protein